MSEYETAYCGYGWIVGLQPGDLGERPMVRISTDPLICLDTAQDLAATLQDLIDGYTGRKN